MSVIEQILSNALSSQERDWMRLQPPGRPLMTQTWRNLVFLHYPLRPEVVQRVLPPSLTVDVFQDESGRDMAWIGLVAFGIEQIRVLGLPSVPGLAAFNEVNVRTYAHLDGKEPSVVFLSLDGGPWPVRTLARATYRVPYVRASVNHNRIENVIHTTSRRRSGEIFELDCKIEPIEGEAPAGSLERFLTDRYQLFATLGEKGVKRAKVSHAPYQIGRLRAFECRTDLPQTVGLPLAPIVHACWCDEVRATFYAPSNLRP